MVMITMMTARGGWQEGRLARPYRAVRQLLAQQEQEQDQEQQEQEQVQELLHLKGSSPGGPVTAPPSRF
jgi:hypothetical protein